MKKRILVLSMIMALLATIMPPTAVFADNTTQVGGTIAAATIEVTAPSAIAFGTFIIGDNTQHSTTEGLVTVTTNSQNPTGWSVTAREALESGDYLGKMVSGSNALNSLLQISKDGVTYGDAYNGIAYTGSGLTGTLPFYAKQNIEGTEAAGDYTITIKFTGSVTF